MNVKTTIAAVSLLSVLSFGAFAAESVTAEQAQNLQPVGTVSLGGVAGVPMDIHQALQAKAEREGASAYRIIEARNNDTWHVTAELYKEVIRWRRPVALSPNRAAPDIKNAIKPCRLPLQLNTLE